MTNINCSSDCIYQKDGQCSYQEVSSSNCSFSSDCAYYIKKAPKDNS